MMIEQRITDQFQDSAQLVQEVAPVFAPLIAAAAQRLTETLLSDGKILACGNGGSAADAQHFAAELVGRFERERPELRALALTTDTSILTAVGNDYSFDDVFARQVRAWGVAGDCLVAISTSGNSTNVIEAIKVGQERGMGVIALTGKGGGVIANLLREEDIHLCVPHNRTARIQEIHMLALHTLCDAIDVCLLGENE